MQKNPISLTKVNCFDTAFHTLIGYISKPDETLGKHRVCRTFPLSDFYFLSTRPTLFQPACTCRSNCDIRQLNLSSDQHATLRRLRTDFKQINDKAYRKTVRSDRNRRQTIIKILSGDSFDSNAARDYVENRYLSSMDYAVDEMEIQYRLYHLLNPRQRQQWLSSCLR